MSPSCDLRPTTVGWALHALEPDDERRVRDHLPHCAACRRTLRETGAVTTLLAASVPAVDPPPGLRDRVLAGADTRLAPPGPDASRPPQPRLPEPRSDEPRHPEADPFAGARSPAAHPAAAGRRWALLAVAAVVVGVVVLSVRAVLPTAPTPAGPPGVAERAQQIVTAAEARDPAGRHAILRGAAGGPVAVVLDDAGGARVVPLALPPAGPDRSYVLWRVGGPAPVAVGVLDAGGDTRPVPPAPGAGTGPVVGFAVSLEPTGPPPARPSVLVAGGVAT